MLRGLSSWKANPQDVFVQTLDSPYTFASAQSFMQAFYPPFSLENNGLAASLDPSAFSSNGSYITAPLGGYQYTSIDTVGITDPYIIYLTGTNNCQSFQRSAADYYNTDQFNDTEAAVRTVYQSLGHAVLNGILPQNQWSYANAYMIYDYLSYIYRHNSTAFQTLTGPGYQESYDRLYTLASQKQWEIYGDKSVSGLLLGDQIRTIGGQTLAARIAGLLLNNVGSGGLGTVSLASETHACMLTGSQKFNLAVGEYDVMMALFSLLNLPNINENFASIPPYASAFAFELFSYENDTSVDQYPDSDSLWVRFLYINGSLSDDNPAPSIQAYPIFSRGPSETDMRWNDFYTLMTDIGLENVGDWCAVCNADSIFCPAFTGSDSTGGSGSSLRRARGGMAPAIAGVIGAVVTLAVIGLLLALAMLIGGVRFHRNNKSKKHDLGGFKGSQKLASDADLHIPKNAAPIGIVANEVPESPKRGHERVGSWEMDKKEGRDTFSSFGGATIKGDDYGRKPSFDDDRDGINPFTSPVNPRESV